MRTASVISGCCGTDIAMSHHRCHLPNNFDSAGYSVYMTVGRETYCYGAFGSKRLLSPQDCVLGDLFPLTPRHSVFAGQMHSLSPSQLIVSLGRLWSRPVADPGFLQGGCGSWCLWSAPSPFMPSLPPTLKKISWELAAR